MKKIIFSILCVAIVSILSFSFAYADTAAPTTPTATPTTTTSDTSGADTISLPPKPTNLPSPTLESVIPDIVKIIFTIAQIAFVIVFLVGGITYITSMGEEAKMEKAKKTITTALIGIVVVFAAWAIASYLIGILKKPL